MLRVEVQRQIQPQDTGGLPPSLRHVFGHVRGKIGNTLQMAGHGQMNASAITSSILCGLLHAGDMVPEGLRRLLNTVNKADGSE